MEDGMGRGNDENRIEWEVESDGKRRVKEEKEKDLLLLYAC
jgi:hypothetical protein